MANDRDHLGLLAPGYLMCDLETIRGSPDVE